MWAARNELTDHDFAIKFLLPALAQNPEALQRFFHEAKACGQIKHPAVVDVYDMGQAEDGSPYIVMELLEGEGLDQRLARGGVFRPAEAALCLAFVARGLEEAHVRGLVHRDIKPGNVFFALDERGGVLPKLLDFGISKATSTASEHLMRTMTGAVLGSPAYMSPEQARGDLDIDSRADVWSLGVILYELLSGNVPFDAGNYNALMVAIITTPHKPLREVAPSVPDALSKLVDHALTKDREARVGTARELAERLEAIASRESDAAGAMELYAPQMTLLGGRRGSLPPSGRAPSRSVNALAGAAGALSIVAIALALVSMRPNVVHVAGRGAIALGNAMARTRGAWAPATASPATAPSVAAEASADGSKQPPAKTATTGRPTGPRAPVAPTTATSKAAAPPDPRTGVEGPGF